MRRLAVSTFAVAMTLFATGCVIAIGTGRRVQPLSDDVHCVVIEGESYIVDLEERTVHPAPEKTETEMEAMED